MKIPGSIFSNKLDWNLNFKEIIAKVNKQMIFLRSIASQQEMVRLWTIYCCSVLEQSSILWQGSLTRENRETLERTRKHFEIYVYSPRKPMLTY